MINRKPAAVLSSSILASLIFCSTIFLIGCDDAIWQNPGQENCPNGKCPSKSFWDQPVSPDKVGPNNIAHGYYFFGGQLISDEYEEIPVFNIPYEMRMKNYAGGSCVHASTEMMLRWQGNEEKADYWRKTYSGGESLSGLVSKMQKEGMSYAYTGNGDENFLEWLNVTRRGGVIFYYPNHSICFAGFSPDNQTAYVLDNNRINNFIAIPKAEFITRWKGYGGVALTVVDLPPPPVLW